VGTIRVENRSTGLRDSLITLMIAVALFGLVLWPAAIMATRPSAEEVARAQQAARQQAQIDDLWRPWTTAAENVALIGGCLAVPIAVGLATYVVVRRTRVAWPIEETPVRVRPQPMTGSAGKGEERVLVGVPVRPEPQSVDAA
jgi:hypothetical protein